VRVLGDQFPHLSDGEVWLGGAVMGDGAGIARGQIGSAFGIEVEAGGLGRGEGHQLGNHAGVHRLKPVRHLAFGDARLVRMIADDGDTVGGEWVGLQVGVGFLAHTRIVTAQFFEHRQHPACRHFIVIEKGQRRLIGGLFIHADVGQEITHRHILSAQNNPSTGLPRATSNGRSTNDREAHAHRA
jgi:hypothetical protein